LSRIVRVFVPGLVAGERTLDEGASRYLVRVHRLATGNRFVAFDPDAALQSAGELVDVRGRRARCRLDAPEPATNIPAFRVTLLQGLGKGDRFDRVVRDATALGAASVVAVETERSVVALGDRAGARLERWRTIAVEAARQSGRGNVPRIAGPCSLGAALRGEDEALRLVLDPEASGSLAARLGDWSPAHPLVLLIGPEGGLAPEELAEARAAGFVPTRFGGFVLRTETAATAVLGAVVSRLER
jgi:16S rRNA (uracil1498-N3)-methyltransferase